MKTLTKVNAYLKGKKTYIVALAGVTSALAGYYTGATTAPEAIELLVTALLGATIRNGIK